MRDAWRGHGATETSQFVERVVASRGSSLAEEGVDVDGKVEFVEDFFLVAKPLKMGTLPETKPASLPLKIGHLKRNCSSVRTIHFQV